MNYEEALSYIHGISWTFCKPGLERIEELCEKLSHPEKDLKFIHVAGTNGKGSFCAMLSQILTKSGYNTGLYTSPFIKRFNERMKVCGVDISDEELAEITEYVKPFAQEMKDRPTEFELITAIAFEYFKRHKTDIVILEAGMGGRLDSTNIIKTPVLSVITGIALDHMAYLGDTVEKIAAEKAGIIKTGIPVLYGGEDKSAGDVIKEIAKEKRSVFYEIDYSNLKINEASVFGCRFDFGNLHDLEISLAGLYQPKNACVVTEAVRILNENGFSISGEALRSGLKTTKWPARFEMISKSPLVIFDGAHNPQGIESAVESIKTYFKNEKVYAITGVLKDKDFKKEARLMSSVISHAFTITPDSPRALSSSEYAKILSAEGIDATPCDSVSSAVKLAMSKAKNDHKALICLGSLYTYSDIVNAIKKAKEK